jgi:hypothetical protein
VVDAVVLAATTTVAWKTEETTSLTLETLVQAPQSALPADLMKVGLVGSNVTHIPSVVDEKSPATQSS